MRRRLLECSTCSSTRPKQLKSGGKYKHVKGFNEQLNVDTFDLPICQQKKVKMLNIVCEGSGMQICTPLWTFDMCQGVRGQKSIPKILAQVGWQTPTCTH